MIDVFLRPCSIHSRIRSLQNKCVLVKGVQIDTSVNNIKELACAQLVNYAGVAFRVREIEICNEQGIAIDCSYSLKHFLDASKYSDITLTYRIDTIHEEWTHTRLCLEQKRFIVRANIMEDGNEVEIDMIKEPCKALAHLRQLDIAEHALNEVILNILSINATSIQDDDLHTKCTSWMESREYQTVAFVLAEEREQLQEIIEMMNDDHYKERAEELRIRQEETFTGRKRGNDNVPAISIRECRRAL